MINLIIYDLKVLEIFKMVSEYSPMSIVRVVRPLILLRVLRSALKFKMQQTRINVILQYNIFLYLFVYFFSSCV